MAGEPSQTTSPLSSRLEELATPYPDRISRLIRRRRLGEAIALTEEMARSRIVLHDFFADVWAVASALGNLTGASGADAPREMAPSLDLSVDGKALTGMIHLSSAQTRTAIELSASVMCQKPKRSGQNAAR